MWVDRDWLEYFAKIRLEFDIVVDIWDLFSRIPYTDEDYIAIRKNRIVTSLGFSPESRRLCILVSAAIHRMEDDGLISVDRSIKPFKYRLNPKALKSRGCKRGRKSYKDLVDIWIKMHPDSTNKSECARDLGLDRKTVRRWWDA